MAVQMLRTQRIGRLLFQVSIKSTVIPCIRAGSFKTGLSNLAHHLGLLGDEMVEKARCPNLQTMIYSSKILWDFNDKKSLESFVVGTDNEMGGKSEAEFTMSRNNKALFVGQLRTEVPRDGKTDYSGYCTLKSRQVYRSFNRRIQMDLTPYNVLNLKVRGDGRSYMVNIRTESYFSHTQDDLWNYFMFTRGGPAWQKVSIPFSKFFLTYRGRIQDNQALVDLEKVNSIGFTMADSIDGVFALEVDHIGVAYDHTHTEEFAYELLPKRKHNRSD